MSKSIYNLRSVNLKNKRQKKRDSRNKKRASIVARGRVALNLPEASIHGLACAARREKDWKLIEKEPQMYALVNKYLSAKNCFYKSREWREVRYIALKKYGRKCACCGGEPPYVAIHVDHIKPRSKYPKLELDINNLQILCEDCNLGKSNTDEIDYR